MPSFFRCRQKLCKQDVVLLKCLQNILILHGRELAINYEKKEKIISDTLYVPIVYINGHVFTPS